MLRRWYPVLLALLVLAYGVWSRVRTPSRAEALATLLDGTPDRVERLAMLEVVSRGSGAGLALVQSEVALFLLGRRQDFSAEAVAALPGLSEAERQVAALDEPSFANYLRGLTELAAGRKDAAKLAFAQAEASARLYELTKLAELAKAQLGKL